ncbi:MAG TPA: hypothetical protein DCP92_08455 [Nitrospiraceae bacterium]|jgi:hypothetical protein|nr:hypothetical protein [Nitrospiraceae bacterium]
MRHLRILSMLLSVMLLSMHMTGCVALVAGGAAGAGVVYIKGQLNENINEPVPRVYDASISALKELGLPLIDYDHDTVSAKIKSKFADGDDIWIEIEAVTAESSKITVRVGVMGDENKSRKILDVIHKHLSESEGGGKAY